MRKKMSKGTSERTKEDILKAAFARSQRDSYGERVTSLGVGENIFWPVADSQGRTQLLIQHHDGVNSDNYYRSAIDLSQVYAPNSVLFPIFEDKTEDLVQLELYARNGDPAQRLLNSLRDSGMHWKDIQEYRRNPFKKTNFYINAFYNDMLQIIKLPKTLFEDMADHKEWPADIVNNPDLAFRVYADDSGPFRKYKSAKLETVTRPDSLLLEPFDLGNVAKRMYLSYTQKVTFVFRSYGDLITNVSLTPEDFGVKELVD